MIRNKITLEFNDTHLERKFKDQNDYSNRIYYRIGCIISAIKWISLNISVYIFFPEHFIEFLIITLAIILPLLLSIFIFTLFRYLKRHYQWLTASVNLIITSILLYLSFFYSGSQTYTSGVMIIMALYVFFIFRLRFKIALTISTISMLAYQILIFIYSSQYTPDQLIINTGIIWGALVSNIFGGYFLEKTSRNLFINNRLLEKQKNEIEEANENLKELDRVKTNFFSNISHEIRTPLTLIISPIESAIQDDFKKSVDMKFLENIQRNSTRLLGLINDLLDFSKIEAGRMSIRAKEIDIVNFLKVFIGTIMSAAESKGVNLEFSSQFDKLNIFLDADKTEKIIINLLSNALKFTRKGDKICVSIREENKCCCIEVEDTGEGIPKDSIDSIFDRFSQIDTGPKRRMEGAGIGLALAKEFTEMQGGSLSVESRFIEDYPDNHGSKFKIIFLKGKEHLEKSDNVKFIEDKEPVTYNHYINIESIKKENTKIESKDEHLYSTDKEHTVLIVEDNNDMINLLIDILSGHYNTLSVSNGKEALELLHSEEYNIDLVLADVMMPVMDGHDLTERIRKEPEYEGLPVILLTARADVSMKVEGIEKGAVDYITKPFNARELFVRIKAQIEMKTLRDKLKRSNEKLYSQLRKKQEASTAISNLSEERVKIIIEFINDNYDTAINRESLAAAVDMNPDHLSRVFNQYTGKKINEYINAIRIKEARKKLENSKYNITEIAISVGFDNLRTFNRYFVNATGVTPTEYRAKNMK